MADDRAFSELEQMYKRLYMLAEQLEKYALSGQAGQEDLKKLHYKTYTLKNEALSRWLDIKKKADLSK